MPNSVSLLTWGDDFSTLGGVISSKTFGIGGHVALKINLESNKENDQFIQELKDSPLEIKEVWDQVKVDGQMVAKKSYEVYFSFRPGKKEEITKSTLVDAGKKGYAALPGIRAAMNPQAIRDNPQIIPATLKTINEILLSAQGYQKSSNPTPDEDRILEQQKVDKKQKSLTDLPGSISEEIEFHHNGQEGLRAITHLAGLDNSIREVMRINELHVKNIQEEVKLALAEREHLLANPRTPLVKVIYDKNLEIGKLNEQLQDLNKQDGNDTEKELLTETIESLQGEIDTILQQTQNDPNYKVIGRKLNEDILTYVQSIDQDIVDSWEAINRIQTFNQSLMSQEELKNGVKKPSQFFIHDITTANNYITEESKKIEALLPGSTQRKARVAKLNEFIKQQSASVEEKFNLLETTLIQRKSELEKELVQVNERIAKEKPGRPYTGNKEELKRVQDELKVVIAELNTLADAKTFGRPPDSTVTCSGDSEYGFNVLNIIREADTIARNETQSRFGSSDAGMTWRALMAGITPAMTQKLRNEGAGKHLFNPAIGLKVNPGNLTAQLIEIRERMSLSEKMKHEENVFNKLLFPEKVHHYLEKMLASELRNDKKNKKYDLLNKLSEDLTRSVMTFKLTQDKDAYQKCLAEFKNICAPLKDNKLLKRSSRKMINQLLKEMAKEENHDLPYPRKLGIKEFIRQKLENFKAKLPTTGVGGFVNRSTQSIINRLTTQIDQIGERNIRVFNINVLKFREIPRLARYVTRNVSRLFFMTNQNMNKNEEKKLLTDLLHYKSLFSLYTNLSSDQDPRLTGIEKELSESKEKLKFYEAKASIYSVNQRYDGKKISPTVADALNEVATLSKEYFKPLQAANDEIIPPPPSQRLGNK